MDERRIDAIARLLAIGSDRRTLAAGLAAALFGGAVVPRAAAGCKNPGQRCDKNRDCCGAASCKGGECKCKNGRDECGNGCVKLDNDERHCGDCSRRCAAGETCQGGTCVGPCGGLSCDASEECVGGVCTTPPGGCPPGGDSCASNDDVPCGSRPGCRCLQSTEGVTFCGNDVPIPGVFCGSCTSSGDCAEFGEDAFCARSTNTDVCCGPDLQNVCQIPCGA